MSLETYQEYAQAALAKHAQSDATSRYALVSAVENTEVKRVLDIGCGAAQELLPFLERTNAFCVGIDIANSLGEVTKTVFKLNDDAQKVGFSRANGASLPFADASFDVVLCQIALPYMNNRQTIAEVARVLRPGGVFLLKIHAPAFYFGMLPERLKTLNPKQIAYPLICLAGSVWHSLTGKQLEKGFWRGKEIFQTRRFLRKEFSKNNLRIERELEDTNKQTPSFYIVKI
jgi:ubiquinone/menaquinone biosynthesis C-methylase UbiE